MARPFTAVVLVLLMLCACSKRTPPTATESTLLPLRAGTVFAGDQLTDFARAQPVSLQEVNSYTSAYPNEGAVLGQGWNSATGKPTLHVCVSGQPEAVQGNSATSEFQYIFDREQLEHAISMSASASYGSMGYSASISATFSNVNLSDRSKTYILGRVITDKGVTFLAGDNPDLTLRNDYRALISTPGEDDASTGTQGDHSTLVTLMKSFRQNCGDGFVAGIRKGGQLAEIFELDSSLASDATAKGIKAKASGYGASASFSLSASDASVFKNDHITARQIQTGGDLTMPTGASEVFSKLEKYATFPPTDSVPYQVIIVPYLAAFPGLKQIGVGADSLGIRTLFWEYPRLLELAKLYSAAVLDRTAYYNPFYLDDTELQQKSDVLAVATRCLETMLATCESTGYCGTSASPDSVKAIGYKQLTDAVQVGACPLQTSRLTDEQQKLVIALLSLDPQSMKDLQQQLLHSNVSGGVSSALDMGQYTGTLAPEIIDAIKAVLPSVSDRGAAPASGSASQGAGNSSLADVPLSMFDFYYGMLARAPIKRIVTGNQPQPGDEYLDAVQVCISRNGEDKCPQLKDFQGIANLTATQPAARLINVTLHDWVLFSRLIPLSESFCAISLQHPMCRSPGYLNAISHNGEAYLGTANGFLPAPSAPSTGDTRTSSKPPFHPVFGCKAICAY